MIGLLKDADLRQDEAPGVVGLRYLARAAARDWGLYHDVDAEPRPGARRPARRRPGRSPEQARVVGGRASAIERGAGRARKGPRWRLRALVGEHLPWHDVVDENEGARIGLREAPQAGAASLHAGGA